MNIADRIKEIAIKNGFWEVGFVEIANLSFYNEIRKLCEENVCRNYGTTWACPPAIGTIQECKERVMQYDKMLLLTKKYELEDSFDIEGMEEGLHDFKISVDIFDQNIKVLNGNVPSFTTKQKGENESYHEYSDYDGYGRCGVAIANISKEMLDSAG